MKAVILAGGLGTRLQELTHVVPKPMVEIGDRPILWHIMKLFAHFGVEDFCVALGYRGEVIKDFFANYHRMTGSLDIDLSNGSVEVLNKAQERWRLQLIETGLKAQTGARLARMKQFVGNERFLLTYGDGVADVDIAELIEFHCAHGKLATVTAVRPPSRFGALEMGEDGGVARFSEKPISGDTWISGGYFVFEPGIFDYLSLDDDCILERTPLESVAAAGQLVAYQHAGFWQCVDTVRDLEVVNDLWKRNQAPWRIWS